MGDGKRGVAPCGHLGEHLTANFVRCTEGCVDDIAPDDSEITLDQALAGELCPKCGSDDTEPFPQLFGMGFGSPSMKHCFPCGHVWVP